MHCKYSPLLVWLDDKIAEIKDMCLGNDTVNHVCIRNPLCS